MANRTEEEEVTLQSPNNPVNVSYDEDQLHPSSDHDDNDEEIQEQRQRRKKDKKKKKRKVKIMNASGQTDADRRLLRQKQRDLHNDIAFDGPVANNSNNDTTNDNDTSDEEEEGGRKSSRLAGWRKENNKLWDDVRFTREAVLDSENMDLISSKAAREVEKIIQVPRYDATTLAQNLVKKGSIRIGNTSHFNWAGLGFQVGVCFSSLPSNCTFLYGPLDAEFKPKERKKAERRKKSTEEEELEQLEETRPDSMDQKEKSKGDGNELSAVESHIKSINKTIKKRTIEEQNKAEERVDEYVRHLTREEGITDERALAKEESKFMREASKVNAVNCLFNPRSFTQTVENIFHFSFTVKEGVSSIKARGTKEAKKYGVEPGPMIEKKCLNDIGLPKQAVIALSMKDWRDMCAAYEVEESDVPHREVGAPARKRARRNE